jgi:hypothetical protein
MSGNFAIQPVTTAQIDAYMAQTGSSKADAMRMCSYMNLQDAINKIKDIPDVQTCLREMYPRPIPMV